MGSIIVDEFELTAMIVDTHTVITQFVFGWGHEVKCMIGLR